MANFIDPALRQNLSLRLDVIAGAEISRTCESASVLSNQLGITVMFKFNGIDVMVCPGDDPASTAEAWRRELNREHPMSYRLVRG